MVRDSVRQEEKLKVYVYDCLAYNQADQFVPNIKEIADHVGHNYFNGADTQDVILHMDEPVLTLPDGLPTDASAPTRRKGEEDL